MSYIIINRRQLGTNEPWEGESGGGQSQENDTLTGRDVIHSQCVQVSATVGTDKAWGRGGVLGGGDCQTRAGRMSRIIVSV